MRFTCPAEKLQTGLSIATRALSARSTLPIYEGVLLKSCEDGLRLTCSDGSITISTVIEADIAQEGSVVLPGRLFYEVVRKMPGSGIISATLSQGNSLTVRCMGSRTTIAGQSAGDYPALPQVSDAEPLMLPQPLLKSMIQQTAFAISSDETRMVLTGSLLEIQKGEARMVSLDGFRLGLRLERINADAPALSAIIPGKTLGEISKILLDDEGAMAMLLIGKNQLMITLGESQLYSTLIEGEYINYRQILPAQWQTRVRVNREELLSCVERASLMAREGKNNLILMKIEEGVMVITANSESGDAYEEIAVTTEGQPLNIAFNVKYVSDVLRVLDDEEIYLRFISGVSPCLICPVEGDAFLYLVLPVRVNA